MTAKPFSRRRTLLWALCVLVLFMVVLITLVIAVTFYCAKSGALQRWVSKNAHAEVNFHLEGLGWKGGDPELSLQHLYISDLHTHQRLIELNHVSVQINLWQSIKSRTLVTEGISLSGLTLRYTQSGPGQPWEIQGFPGQGHSNPKAFLHWLALQKQLSLDHSILWFGSKNASAIGLLINRVQLHRLTPRPSRQQSVPHTWALEGILSVATSRFQLPVQLTGVVQGQMEFPQTLSANLSFSHFLGGTVGIQTYPNPHQPDARIWNVQANQLSTDAMAPWLDGYHGTLSSLILVINQQEGMLHLQQLAAIFSQLGRYPSASLPGFELQRLMLSGKEGWIQWTLPVQNLIITQVAQDSSSTVIRSSALNLGGSSQASSASDPSGSRSSGGSVSASALKVAMSTAKLPQMVFQMSGQLTGIRNTQVSNTPETPLKTSAGFSKQLHLPWTWALHASIQGEGLSSQWTAYALKFEHMPWSMTPVEIHSETLWNNPLHALAQWVFPALGPQSLQQWADAHQVSLNQIHASIQYQGPVDTLSALSNWKLAGQFQGLSAQWNPEWPPVLDAGGVFGLTSDEKGQAVWYASAQTGHSMGVSLQHAEWRSDPLSLRVEGAASLSAAKAYMMFTPLKSTLSSVFHTLLLSHGTVHASISLRPQMQWSTRLNFQHVEVQLAAMPSLTVKHIEGQLHLIDQDFQPDSFVHGVWLKQPFEAHFLTMPHQFQIHMQGRADVDALAHQFPAAVWGSFSGFMPFTLEYIHADRDRLILQGDLTSVGSELLGTSSPFAKLPGQPMTLSASMSWMEGQPKWLIGLELNRPSQASTKINGVWNIASGQSHWSGSIQSPWIEGTVEWVPHAWSCQLKTLKWITSENTKKEASDPAQNHASSEQDAWDPATWPTIQCDIQHVYWNRMPLGSLHVQGMSTKQGYTLQSLQLNGPDQSLTANGFFQKSPTGLLDSRYQMTLSSQNWGALLTQLGEGAWMSGGNGTLKGRLEYQSHGFLPTGSIAKETLTGSWDLDLKNGSLSSVDPGMARFLGLFNFGDVAKRIQLNFSDIMSKGLAFDELKGYIDWAGQIVSTPKITLSGPALNLLLRGNTSIVTHEIHLQILVIPQVGGGMALVATLLGGPIAGAATWVADKVLSSTVLKDKGFVYEMTGTWSDPVFSST